MKNNLIFLSGPMGSGKTSLARRLQQSSPQISVPELFSRNVKFHTDPSLRRVLKIAGRAIENFEYTQIAERDPTKVVLGNRCIYDCKVYNAAYLERGFISREEYEFAEKLCEKAFSEANLYPLAIIPNPGEETVRRHLAKRQKTDLAKWGENDLQLIRSVCGFFEAYRANEQVLYLDKEINLENEQEMDFIRSWIFERTGVKPAETTAYVP